VPIRSGSRLDCLESDRYAEQHRPGNGCSRLCDLLHIQSWTFIVMMAAQHKVEIALLPVRED